MKFKDLKIGDRFRQSHWPPGVISEKIEPYKVTADDGRVAYATHKEIVPPTNTRGWFVKDDDEVIKVK